MSKRNKRPIKLSFGIKYEQNTSSGKHKFANRLAQAISGIYPDRVEIVSRIAPSDVHITFDGKCKEKSKNIYRIDGVWINNADNLKTKNDPILSGLRHADGIVFQSEFCEMAVRKYLGINPPRSTIIYNGAEPSEFIKEEKYNPHVPIFAAICKWRPHKRLEDVIQGFIRSKVSAKSKLYIFGEVENPVLHPNIVYKGWSQESNKILPWCLATVHISYLDWCPNAVVESLVAGVPVIYSDSGGTPYVVKDDGFKIKDHSWDFKALDLYGSHPLDIDELARAYEAAFEAKKKVKRSDLHINQVASRYVKYIEKIA